MILKIINKIKTINTFTFKSFSPNINDAMKLMKVGCLEELFIWKNKWDL